MRELKATITADGGNFQNDDLIFAVVKFAILNNQVLTIKKGDFTFDPVTGTITFVSVILSANDTLTIMYKK